MQRITREEGTKGIVGCRGIGGKEASLARRECRVAMKPGPKRESGWAQRGVGGREKRKKGGREKPSPVVLGKGPGRHTKQTEVGKGAEDDRELQFRAHSNPRSR